MEDLDLYTPSEAVKYLRETKGIIITVDGLKSRRKRNPELAKHQRKRIPGLVNTTLWTRAELDAIQPSKRTKREKKSDGAIDLSRCSWNSAKPSSNQGRGVPDALIA